MATKLYVGGLSFDTTEEGLDQEMLSELGPQASVGVGLALRFIGDR